MHEIPQLGPAAKGKAIVNLLQLEKGERVATTVAVREFPADQFLFFAVTCAHPLDADRPSNDPGQRQRDRDLSDRDRLILRLDIDRDYATYWKLTVVDTEPVIMAESQQREAYLQLREDTNTLRGFAGCNNFSGGYEVVASQLSLQYLARTRKACPEVMSAEVKFLSALDRAVSFAIVGEVLTLIDEAGAPAAEFLAVYF